jgi:hypothetical protein
MTDERDPRGVVPRYCMNDQAVVETRNRLAAQAARQSRFDVIAELRFLADGAWNPSESEQGVRKRMGDVGHRAGA